MAPRDERHNSVAMGLSGSDLTRNELHKIERVEADAEIDWFCEATPVD